MMKLTLTSKLSSQRAKPPEQQKAGASANSQPAGSRNNLDMENYTKNASPEQRQGRNANACTKLSDLGEYVHKINALLKAAGNTGAGEREEEAWLVSLAWDQAIEMKQRYMEWDAGPDGEAA